jgi:hypothetical protein
MDAEKTARINREQRLQILQEIAHSRGGVCLSNEYINSFQEKMLWECAAGHRWQATAFSIMTQGSWCKQCYYQSLRLGIEYFHNEAAKHGGKCLSPSYNTVNQYLKWQCAQGHVWHASARHVLGGTWCPHCVHDNMRLGIEKMRQFAQSRNGECCSDHYVNSGLPLRWRCANKHDFLMTYDNAKAGHWCPHCAKAERDAKRLQMMRTIAVERGGLCLSDEYFGSREKLLWQCHLGHTWYAMPVSVKSGTWCPECAYLNLCENDESRSKYLVTRHNNPGIHFG